ncbi:MAG: hypothetical protein ACOC32_02155 [Nanoarchaeota archaeon]
MDIRLFSIIFLIIGMSVLAGCAMDTNYVTVKTADPVLQENGREEAGLIAENNTQVPPDIP